MWVGKIVALGRTYDAHAREMNAAVAEEPLVFLKPSTAILTQGHPIELPSFSDDVHHEVELVLDVALPRLRPTRSPGGEDPLAGGWRAVGPPRRVVRPRRPVSARSSGSSRPNERRGEYLRDRTRPGVPVAARRPRCSNQAVDLGTIHRLIRHSGADRRPETLGEADHHGIDAASELGRRHVQRSGGVEQAAEHRAARLGLMLS